MPRKRKRSLTGKRELRTSRQRLSPQSDAERKASERLVETPSQTLLRQAGNTKRAVVKTEASACGSAFRPPVDVCTARDVQFPYAPDQRQGKQKGPLYVWPDGKQCTVPALQDCAQLLRDNNCPPQTGKTSARDGANAVKRANASGVSTRQKDKVASGDATASSLGKAGKQNSLSKKLQGALVKELRGLLADEYKDGRTSFGNKRESKSVVKREGHAFDDRDSTPTGQRSDDVSSSDSSTNSDDETRNSNRKRKRVDRTYVQRRSRLASRCNRLKKHVRVLSSDSSPTKTPPVTRASSRETQGRRSADGNFVPAIQHPPAKKYKFSTSSDEVAPEAGPPSTSSRADVAPKAEARKSSTSSEAKKSSTSSEARKSSTSSEARKSSTSREAKKPWTSSKAKNPSTSGEAKRTSTSSERAAEQPKAMFGIAGKSQAPVDSDQGPEAAKKGKKLAGWMEQELEQKLQRSRSKLLESQTKLDAKKEQAARRSLEQQRFEKCKREMDEERWKLLKVQKEMVARMAALQCDWVEMGKEDAVLLSDSVDEEESKRDDADMRRKRRQRKNQDLAPPGNNRLSQKTVVRLSDSSGDERGARARDDVVWRPGHGTDSKRDRICLTSVDRAIEAVVRNDESGTMFNNGRPKHADQDPLEVTDSRRQDPWTNVTFVSVQGGAPTIEAAPAVAPIQSVFVKEECDQGDFLPESLDTPCYCDSGKQFAECHGGDVGDSTDSVLGTRAAPSSSGLGPSLLSPQPPPLKKNRGPLRRRPNVTDTLCPKCGATFFDRPSLDAHIWSEHGASQHVAHICHQCGERLPGRSELHKHLANHCRRRQTYPAGEAYGAEHDQKTLLRPASQDYAPVSNQTAPYLAPDYFPPDPSPRYDGQRPGQGGTGCQATHYGQQYGQPAAVCVQGNLQFRDKESHDAHMFHHAGSVHQMAQPDEAPPKPGHPAVNYVVQYTTHRPQYAAQQQQCWPQHQTQYVAQQPHQPPSSLYVTSQQAAQLGTQHAATAPRPEHQYQCSVCPNSYADRGDYLVHLSTHDPMELLASSDALFGQKY